MAGGWGSGSGSSNRLSSTETLVDGEQNWLEVGQLPVAMRGLRAVSLYNDIFITGNMIIKFSFILITILIFQEEMLEVTVIPF